MLSFLDFLLRLEPGRAIHSQSASPVIESSQFVGIQLLQIQEKLLSLLNCPFEAWCNRMIRRVTSLPRQLIEILLWSLSQVEVPKP